MGKALNTRKTVTPADPGPMQFDSAREENCVSIFSSIMRIHDQFMSIGEDRAVRFDLHIAELNVVNTLGKLGPVTMGALSRATFISPANTTHTVKKLESRGLVTRRRSQESERVVIVQLTTQGKELFKECYPEVLNTISDLLDERVGDEGRRELADLLQRLGT